MSLLMVPWIANGPVASNHVKLLTTANFLLLWHYGVPHAKVNGTDKEMGENREGNRVGNGRRRPMGTEPDRGQKKGRQAGARRTLGTGSEKTSVGEERGGVPGDLRGKGRRLDSALTISGTGATGDWSWHFSGWTRPTWT